MLLRELGAALRRRWYLTIAIVVVSALAGAGAAQLAGADYRAVATSVLIPPQSTADAAARSTGSPGNPLLYLSQLSQARDVLAHAMLSQQVVDDVAGAGPGATYTAANDPTSSAPIMVLSVEAQSGTAALEGLRILRERLPTTMTTIQQRVGVASNNFVTVLELTADTNAEANRKSQIQAAIFVTALSLFLGLFILAYVDGAAQSRRRPSARSREQPSVSADAATPTAEARGREVAGAGVRREARGRSSGPLQSSGKLHSAEDSSEMTVPH